MRLIQSRNILLTCLYQTRKLSGPVFVCYMHGIDFASVYNVSIGLREMFRQCGICVPTVWYRFWFSFHFWKNPIFGSSPKNASHCIQSYTVKHG